MKKNLVLLIVLLLLGFFLRTAYLPDNLFFGYEQGRDALVVKDLLGGKLTLLGPKTDIEGLFHGPLFYYLIALPYLLGQGNPAVVSFFLIFLSSLGIPLIYFVGKSLFNSRVGMLSAIFYTFSYGAIIYSRWLANPVLTPVFVMILIFSFLKVKKDSRFLISMAFSLAVIVHFEIVAAIFLLPVVLIYWKWEKIPSPSTKNLFFCFLVFLLFLSSYFLFELRHQFLQTKAFLSFLSNFSGAGFNISNLVKVVRLYFDEFIFFVTPGFAWGGLLLLGAIFLRHKLLWLWLLTTPLFMFIFSRFSLSHLFIVLGPAFIILISYLIDFFWQKKRCWLSVGIVVLILVTDLLAFFKSLPQNNGVFFQAGQRLFKYGEMLKVVDYLYQDTAGNQFSVHPFTIPYFSDHAWRYLFSWYGLKKYGYLPAEVGSKTFYTIYQPDEGQPWFLADWLVKEDKQGKMLKKTQFGVITIEKREVR